MVVAEGDDDAVEFDGQRYHLSHLMKNQPQGIKHKQVFNKLRVLHSKLSGLENHSAAEDQNFKLLHKVLFRTNGISKK